MLESQKIIYGVQVYSELAYCYAKMGDSFLAQTYLTKYDDEFGDYPIDSIH